MRKLNYLDLFAGAGGLSEGFMRAGVVPIAHVEMDLAACFTLKTRLAFKWLEKHNQKEIYYSYLNGDITRDELYSRIPRRLLDSVLNYEISEDTIQEIFSSIDSLLEGEGIDLIVGGPPCQAYSIIGRARDKKNMEGDKRNYLYRLYALFLEKYKPKYFVFENVLGILSAKDVDGKFHFEKMRDLFRKKGYSTEYQIVNSADFGVLQNRKRVILIGKYGEQENFYPKLQPIENTYKVAEIFKDLPRIQAGEGTFSLVKTTDYEGEYLFLSKIKEKNGEPTTFHIARPQTIRDKEIYGIAVRMWNEEHKRLSYVDLPSQLQTQKNRKSFLDRFKVVAGDLDKSQTIVAHISKDGHYFIHPDIAQNRSLTPREAARLQTFPDNYYFESVSGKPSRTAAYRQIGNAVPVCLAETIALALLEVWDE
ncbi:DNA cytosine methyltransferase [uncultured Dubosiella sp.]|uniref:DNA cytosine methyltransferase n=1 Tax=uncultured Dubosiella sp. TaxID=1937011 RepID=UPI0025B3C71C|nr:DNA cytosine methyltransferase [uncultured Dubosiella sp.]